MDNLIGKKIQVLDQGYIMLVDIMGSDEEICNAARVSYDEKSTKKKRDDKDLIDYLIRHRHTSPLEMAELKFEVKLPLFCEAQWVRHRTCSMNQMSARYSELPEEYYMPNERVIGEQSSINKQARDVGQYHLWGKTFQDGLRRVCSAAFSQYQDSLQNGIPRELARIQTPVGTYTKKVWKMDLHNLLHFLKLRTDSHAQYEIRQYAIEIEKIVEQCFPMVYQSWKNHIKESVSFSQDEINVLKKHFQINYKEMLEDIAQSNLNKSRKREMIDKLKMFLIYNDDGEW